MSYPYYTVTHNPYNIVNGYIPYTNTYNPYTITYNPYTITYNTPYIITTTPYIITTTTRRYYYEPNSNESIGTQTEDKEYEEVDEEVKEELVLPEIKEEVFPIKEEVDDFEIVTVEDVEEDEDTNKVKLDNAQELLFGKEAEEAFLKERE